MKDTLVGRVIGILVGDGSDSDSIDAVKNSVIGAGAKVKIVAMKIGGSKLADGWIIPVDGQLAGTPSVLFDAIAVILSEESAVLLGSEAAAVDFVRDAFNHLKAICVDAGGLALLKIAGIEEDAGIIALSSLDCFIAAAKTRQWDREAKVRTLA
jgi:catalase